MACLSASNLHAAEPTPAPVERWVAGITEPIFDVMLSSQAAGTLTTNFFREGDFVHKGQVLLELDKRLEELNVARRKIVLDTLKTDWEGTRQLYDATKSVSRDDLVKKETEYKVAEVDYQTAVEQLRRRQIISPIEGYIAEIIPHLGEDCKAQDPVVRVVDTRRCYFICNVEAKRAGGLKSGQSVNLSIEVGVAMVPVEGRIWFVSPVVDPASGLLKVKVVFDNPDARIHPGVTGKMQLDS